MIADTWLPARERIFDTADAAFKVETDVKN